MWNNFNVTLIISSLQSTAVLHSSQVLFCYREPTFLYVIKFPIDKKKSPTLLFYLLNIMLHSIFKGAVTFTVFGWNPVISVFQLQSPQHRFHNGFKSVMWIYCIDQHKDAWFECDFCVSCASYIPTQLTTDSGPFSPQKCNYIYRNKICCHVNFQGLYIKKKHCK